MSKHLSVEELVDALEGTLSGPKVAHLAVCTSCRDHVESLRPLVGDVKDVEVPEPSPLFWDHFSARVREAVLSDPMPAPRQTWLSWRPLLTLATSLAALVLAVALFRPAQPPAVDDPTATPAANSIDASSQPGVPLDDMQWHLLIDAAGDLDWSDVRDVAMPRLGTADAIIDELTAAQREELVRLLKAEIGAD